MSFTLLLSACSSGDDGSSSTTTANAGVDQNITTGSVVTLDGSASTPATTGDSLTYSWSFTSVPAGSSAALSDATVVDPTFTADLEGAYVLSLIVNDGKVDSTAASVTITAATTNSAPVANAGTAQSVIIGTVVTLDGSASSDANGDPLTYTWVFTSAPAGSSAALSDATVVNPTFTADLEGDYALSLIVNDGTVDSAAATVNLFTALTANSAPAADAGTAQSVVTGGVVTLDGSASSDANSDPLTYTWVFSSVPAGSSAALSDATVVNPTFTADIDGDYALSLIVNDGTVDSVVATVTITAAAANSAPVADAGTVQSVVTGDVVTLDGSASSDADSDPLTYSWSFTSVPAGSSAALSDATVVNPTFIADLDGDYALSLIVNDGTVNSAAATVSITTATVGNVAIAEYIQVDITDGTGPVSSTNYAENAEDIIVQAVLNQADVAGPTTSLLLLGNITPVFMEIRYPGTSTGVHTFDASTTTGYYWDAGYSNEEDGTVNTGGSIDVTTYDAVGGVFDGTYSMDLCNIDDIFNASCNATTAVNFAGSFTAQVEENFGSIGNPIAIPIYGSIQHGMNSTFAINYYSAFGLTPSAVYSIKLGGFSGTGDMNLALTDAAGTTISCDVLAIVPDGVAEECQFTADANGSANFKVSYAAGAPQEQYDISLSAVTPPLVAEGSIATPVTLALGTADLPHAGTVDSSMSYYEITGLTAATSYNISAATSATIDSTSDVVLSVWTVDPAATWDPVAAACYQVDLYSLGTESCLISTAGTSVWVMVNGYLAAPSDFILNAVEVAAPITHTVAPGFVSYDVQSLVLVEIAVTAGSSYIISWDDAYEGSGAYAGDLLVSANYADGAAIFTSIDSGYLIPQVFTATQTGTVTILLEPFSSFTTGIVGLEVTSP